MISSLSFSKKLLRTGMGCFLFFGLFTAVNLLFFPFASSLYGYARPLVGLTCVAFLGIFACAARCLDRLSEPRCQSIACTAVPLFLALTFILHIFFIYWMEYTPSGDNYALFQGAQLLARDGDFHVYPDFGLYLARFSNQWGFLLFLTAFLKLLMALGVTSFFAPTAWVQALLYVLALHTLLRMAKRHRGVHAQLLLLVLLLFCLPLLLAASVLYTDTFSLPFVLFTLDAGDRARLASSRRDQLLFALLCGLFAWIGGMIKMTVCIALFASMIVWLLTMRLPRALACILLSGALVLGGTWGIQSAMLGTVIDPDTYAQQHTPTIHWFMMSIPTGDNPYGGLSGDYGITWGMMDQGASHEEVMDSIHQRISDRLYTLRYPNRLALAMARKNAAAMGDGTFGMTEMLDDGPVRRNAFSEFVLSDGAHYALYTTFCTGVFAAIVLLSLFACFTDIRRGRLDSALYCIALFGLMLFLMLWEARSRYLFNFVPVLWMLAAFGLTRQETSADLSAQRTRNIR